jgi:hypothetical protein
VDDKETEINEFNSNRFKQNILENSVELGSEEN